MTTNARAAPPCRHGWLPLEFQAGRKSYADYAARTGYTEWTCSLASADRLRVTKYWCPRCGRIYRVPLTEPAAEPPSKEEPS